MYESAMILRKSGQKIEKNKFSGDFIFAKCKRNDNG